MVWPNFEERKLSVSKSIYGDTSRRHRANSARLASWLEPTMVVALTLAPSTSNSLSQLERILYRKRQVKTLWRMASCHLKWPKRPTLNRHSLWFILAWMNRAEERCQQLILTDRPSQAQRKTRLELKMSPTFSRLWTIYWIQRRSSTRNRSQSRCC